MNSRKLMCLERASERPGMLSHCWSVLGPAFVPWPLGAGVWGSGVLITGRSRSGWGWVTPGSPAPTPDHREGAHPIPQVQVHGVGRQGDLQVGGGWSGDCWGRDDTLKAELEDGGPGEQAGG